MTDRELKKLRRVDLLEILVEQSREIERLRTELEEAQEKLESRALVMEKAGSIAEAALQINKIFEAADAAAKQYLENVMEMSGKTADISEVDSETEQKEENDIEKREAV